MHPSSRKPATFPSRFAAAFPGCLAFALTIVEPAAGEASANLKAQDLRCEYRTNPVGMDVTVPRLSWTLAAEQRAQRQSACRILVAASREALASGRGDLWDSGRMNANESLHHEYAGKPLASRMEVHWKVQVWDQDGRVSAWSAPATWTMGLLEPTDWQARWIADARSMAENRSTVPNNGYHSAFASRAETQKWVVCDLGATRQFDMLKLWPARPFDWQPDTPGFLFPLRFRLEGAAQADFSDACLLVDRTAADAANPGTDAMQMRFAAAAFRFVRLTVTRLRERDPGNFGFALAEMELLDGEKSIAAGSRITTSDSMESGAWSNRHLVDGCTRTVPPDSGPAALPATQVRKSFQLEAPVRRATVFVSALGLYELHLNGRRVGNALLAPEWTDYRKRVQYQTHDVTALVQAGPNAVGALLGEGWFAGRLMAVGRFPYGNAPRFLLQLEIELVNGKTVSICSDASWRSTTDGPIRAAGIYDGEIFDARREIAGWDSAAFDDRAWHPVQTLAAADGPKLVWQCNEPIRVARELAPVSLTEPKPGVFVFDLGQNMVGWCRLQARGKAGRTVTLRHAEVLNDDGTLYTANLRGAPQVDCFIPGADGVFVFEPRFTYHGFRFVELTGLDAAPEVRSLTGRVFHSAAPEVGKFECSEPALNQLARNILWTQRGNLMSSPNDCPQRDERFGWMGDIQAFAQTGIFNMDLAAFLTKFTRDIRDGQAGNGRFPDFAPHPGNPDKQFSGAPAWADAGVMVPWRAWQNYADLRMLRDHFDAARRWVDYVHGHNPELIWTAQRHNDYNDWLNGDWIRQAGWPAKGGSVPKEVFATAFWAHSTDLLSRMAALLGRADDTKKYRELFAGICTAFNKHFVQPDGRITGDTQGGYALALHFDLLPAPLLPKAAQHLVEGIHRYQDHLSTGIQTTHRAMLELPRRGHADLAWKLLTDRTFPSWRYMIDNGATTIWERWDGSVKGRGFQDAGMNSFNHWAFGAVGEWLWRHVGGLNPDDAQPGWKHFTVEPRPGGGVTWARVEYDSIRGRIASAWRLQDGQFELDVTIPANATATVVLPPGMAETITEGGRPLEAVPEVKRVRLSDGRPALEAASGSYRFASKGVR
ncbi:MAG: glycoside hydrolase family 78 protein [Verrucomicrobiales bacterium]|nr:glycoside hydrolase family 78 protein [Verrucomicrobiales bacterium]